MNIISSSTLRLSERYKSDMFNKSVTGNTYTVCLRIWCHITTIVKRNFNIISSSTLTLTDRYRSEMFSSNALRLSDPYSCVFKKSVTNDTLTACQRLIHWISTYLEPNDCFLKTQPEYRSGTLSLSDCTRNGIFNDSESNDILTEFWLLS